MNDVATQMLEKVFPGGRRINPLWLLLIVAGAWLLSGFYIVGPDEMGVIRRFGVYSRSTGPGPHYHLPYPIEKVDTPKVTQVQRLEVGFRTVDPGPPARYVTIPQESLMLTGDENLINVDLIVQYKINDPVRYLFNIKRIYTCVKDGTEAAIRQVIGSHLIDEALTTGKFDIQEKTKDQLQTILDRYESGLLVLNVQLQDVHPPEDVIHAFKDVASAKEDKSRLINEAEGYRSDIIPRTRGNGEKAVKDAEAYMEKRVKEAEGDVARFLAIRKEYIKSPGVMEKRLYLETMEEILPRLTKYIVPEGEGGSLLNVLPFDGGFEKGGGK